MQHIDVTIVTSKGLVVQRALTRADAQPAILSLPPGAKLSVSVKGALPGKAPAASTGVKALQTKRMGDDLLLEAEGETVLQLSQYFKTEGVSVADAVWDPAPWGQPSAVSKPGQTEATPEATASTTAAEPVAPADSSASSAKSGVGWGGLALGVLALGAAGGGGGSSGGSGSTSSVVSGTITAGPVTGNKTLLITLYKSDGTTVLGSAQIDPGGKFSVTVNHYTGVVIAKVTSPGTGPDYTDEATGAGIELPDDAPLLAITSVGTGSATVHVNPLTTLAAQKAGLGSKGEVPTGTSITASQVAAINAAIAKSLGLSGDVTKLAVTPSVNADGSAQTPNDVGAILAAISGLAAGKSQKQVYEQLKGLLDSSGGLNDEGLNQLLQGAQAAGGAAQETLRKNLAKGQNAAGFGIDDVGGLTPTTTITSIKGTLPQGTDVTQLSMQLFGPADPKNPTRGTGSFAQRTATSWEYTLSPADVAFLKGGATNGKDGPERIELLLSGQRKAVNHVFYDNGVADDPIAVTLVNLKSSLPESAFDSPGTDDIKVADVLLADPDGGTPTFTLGGAQAAMFEVRTTPASGSKKANYALYLKKNSALNADSLSSLTVEVAVGATKSAAYSLHIDSVNYAPVVAAGQTNQSLSAVNEDTLAPAGASVSSLFGAAYSNAGHDAYDTLQGVAILANQATSSQGKWQYTLNNGSNWVDLATAGLSDTTALYLSANTTLRFVPASNYNGAPGGLTARLVDSSALGLVNASTINASNNGGYTAYSQGTVNLGTSITPVNDAPVATQGLVDRVVEANGMAVTWSLPVNELFTDVDGDALTFSLREVGTNTLPSGLSWANNTLSVNTTTPGKWDLRLTADDGHGGSAYIPFTLTAAASSTLTAPKPRLLEDSGKSSTDGVTHTKTVLVDGLLLGSIPWEYSIDNGTTWRTGTGNSFDLGADGQYKVQVRQSGRVSVTLEVTVDTGFDDKQTSITPGLWCEDFYSGNSSSFTGQKTTIGAGLNNDWVDLYIKGTTEPYAKVTGQFAGQVFTADADAAGKWQHLITADDVKRAGVGLETMTLSSVQDLAGNYLNFSEGQVKADVEFRTTSRTKSNAQTGYPGGTYVDALIEGGVGWNGTEITYAFDNSGWTDAEKTAFRAATQTYSNVCQLKFTELSWDASIQGAANWELTKYSGVPNSDGSTTTGSFEFPVHGYERTKGSFLGKFNQAFRGWSMQNTGSYSSNLLVHEMGHALGLSHPFHGTPTFPGVSFDPDSPWTEYGDFGLNDSVWTVMSYSSGWQYADMSKLWGTTSNMTFGAAYTPMLFDIAALQTLYGKNTTYRSGSDTYTLPTSFSSGTGWSCVWDTGGDDTITNAGSSLSCVINLNAYPIQGGQDSAPYVSRAMTSDGSNIPGGFTIADGATIENATGGNGNDTLTGNAVANRLVGGAGLDTLAGGLGNDTLTGGLGNDTLTGGTGADRFVFDTTPSGVNMDTVTDFSAAEGDQIALSRLIFTVLATGSLQATQLRAGAGVAAAADADDYLLYNTTTGALYYDPDGSGTAAAVQFALLSNKPTLAASQFVVI